MRAVFFVTGLDSGGIENYLLRFIKEKECLFEQIFIFCKGGKIGQLESEYIKHSNVIIIRKRLGYVNLFDYIDLYKFFQKENCDIVCDFTGNFAGLILRTAYFASIKHRIAFYRNSNDHFKSSYLKNKYNQWVKTQTQKYSTKILSNSQSAFDYFFPNEWVNNSKFDILYNGINPNEFITNNNDLRQQFNIPKNAFVVGHTGRYNDAKNHQVILKVAEKLVNKYDDLYFIMCGNGVKNNLYQILKDKGINKKVLVFENRRDIPIFLNTMNLYLFPSLTEGQPNALLEAMLMGLPFIASNINPIKEIVPKSFWKYLVDPNDSESMINIIENFKVEPMINFKKQEISEYIIKNFNAKKQFDKLYEYLTNNCNDNKVLK